MTATLHIYPVLPSKCFHSGHPLHLQTLLKGTGPLAILWIAQSGLELNVAILKSFYLSFHITVIKSIHCHIQLLATILQQKSR